MQILLPRRSSPGFVAAIADAFGEVMLVLAADNRAVVRDETAKATTLDTEHIVAQLAGRDRFTQDQGL